MTGEGEAIDSVTIESTVIRLGDRVRDRVTGFEGIVVAKTEWLNGCVRMNVEPPVDKDGKTRDVVAFDLQQIELLEAGAFNPTVKNVIAPAQPARAGGPQRGEKLKET